MRISFSSLETYEQCPQKYKFAVIEKRKAPKSKEAVFGTAVHATLKYMFSRDPLFPTLEEVLAHFRNYIFDTDAIPDTEKERFRESGERMISNFYKKNPPWNFQVVGLESRFEVALDDPVYDTKHVLVGIIDRIDKLPDGTYEIIDYKTSRRLPSQEAVDSNKQLALYQLGLRKRWPHLKPEDITLSLQFLRAGEKFSTKRTLSALKNTETQILSRLHTIEQKTAVDDFPPIPNPLCDWCAYKSVCPAWSHLYKKEEDKRDIKEVLAEYFKLKKEVDERDKRISQLTKHIKEYLDAENLDRVFGDDGTISRTQQERTSWNTDKIREILEHSVYWDRLISADPAKLKKILPALPYELQERLKNEAQIVKKFSMLKTSKKKETLEENITEE